jgi:hypothetical protein
MRRKEKEVKTILNPFGGLSELYLLLDFSYIKDNIQVL